MAPEVAIGNKYSNPVDIWAIGIIMHILLAEGKHPFFDPNTDSVATFKEKLT